MIQNWFGYKFYNKVYTYSCGIAAATVKFNHILRLLWIWNQLSYMDFDETQWDSETFKIVKTVLRMIQNDSNPTEYLVLKIIQFTLRYPTEYIVLKIA